MSPGTHSPTVISQDCLVHLLLRRSTPLMVSVSGICCSLQRLLSGDRAGRRSIRINQHCCARKIGPAAFPPGASRRDFARRTRGTRDVGKGPLPPALHVPGNRITAILKGQRGVTADTALRLSRYLNTTPEFWLNLQKTFELLVAEIEAGQGNYETDQTTESGRVGESICGSTAIVRIW